MVSPMIRIIISKRFWPTEMKMKCGRHDIVTKKQKIGLLVWGWVIGVR